MLPSVITSKFGKTAIAGLTALSLTVSGAAPALAWGKNEQKFVQGAVAAIVIDRLIQDAKRHRQPQYMPVAPQPRYNFVQPQYRPVYQPPVYQAPVQPRYQANYSRYRQTYQSSIYSTPAAQVFNSYGYSDRKRIQQRLAAFGYYRSGIDGSFGPGTYNAIVAYANDRGQSGQLRNTSGVYGVFDGLIY